MSRSFIVIKTHSINLIRHRRNTSSHKMKNKIKTIILAAIFIFLADFAQATIYTYVDSKGVTHYTNVPKNKDAKPLNLSGVPLKRSFRVSRNSNSLPMGDIDKYIKIASSLYQVDPMLIKAMVKVESNFNHKAVSHKGAMGLMQLMPGTANDMQVWDALDPYQNIIGGTRYFRQMLNKFDGNLSLSLAAYNAGPARVARVGKVPNINETMNYVQKVISIYERYKRQKSSPVKTLPASMFATNKKGKNSKTSVDTVTIDDAPVLSDYSPSFSTDTVINLQQLVIR